MANMYRARLAANNKPLFRFYFHDGLNQPVVDLTYEDAYLIIGVIRELSSTPTLYLAGEGDMENITTLGTYAAPSAGKCRFKAIDNTNLEGFYEMQFAEALFDNSDASRYVSIFIAMPGPADSRKTLYEVELGSLDPQANGVTLADDAITAAAIATGAIDADALAADGLAEIADAVWDEALAGHAGAGTAGAALSAATAPTVGQVADAVWDEAIAGHLGVGSTGAALSAAGSAGDPWLTALPGAYGAGTAGDIIGNLVTDIGALTPAVAISATTAASVSTGALAVRTYHSLSQAISSTYAGNLNAATKLWLAVKAEKDDTDAQAVIFIEKTAGLTVLAGAAYTTVAHGSLTIGGLAGAWTVTVALDEIATGLLTAYADGMLWAECKALVAGSTVAVWDGVCDISRGIVNAVT